MLWWSLLPSGKRQTSNVMGFNDYVGKLSKKELENAEEAASF